MKNLSTAIYSKAAASTSFMALIGSRFYKGVAPAGAVYPYVVYSMIYNNTDNTFDEEIEDCLFQFSIFSADGSSLEVENLFTALKGVFDKCTLSVTGNTFLHMLRQQATLFEDELPNPNGTGWVWHYAVDYNIMMQKTPTEQIPDGYSILTSDGSVITSDGVEVTSNNNSIYAID